MGTKFGFKKQVDSAHSVVSAKYSLKTDHGLLTSVYDRSNGISFLLDTEAVVSLIPPFETSHEPHAGRQNLIAVNGSPVRILGVKALKIRNTPSMDLQSCRYAILGSGFLSFYGFKVDSSCGRLRKSQKCARNPIFIKRRSPLQSSRNVVRIMLTSS